MSLVGTSIYDSKALWLTGTVGSFTGEEGFTAVAVRNALALHGEGPIDVYINSAGGFVTDGISIHNMLKAHPGGATVIVDGWALSAGSLIAMAGREIVMRAGSLMMIHDASGGIYGNPATIEKELEVLKKQARVFAEIYAARSKKPVEVVEALMRAETWYTPSEAVAEGFADRVDTIASRPVASGARAEAYKHTPADLVRRQGKHVLGGAVERTNALRNGKPAPKEERPATKLGTLMTDISRRRTRY